MPPNLVNYAEGQKTSPGDNGHHEDATLVDAEDIISGRLSVEDANKIINEKLAQLNEAKRIFNEQVKSIASQNNPTQEKQIDFNKPDPLMRYTGLLGRYQGRDWVYITAVEDVDFDDIAFHYGRGTYGLRLGDMTGKQIRFTISADAEIQQRKQRDDHGSIYDYRVNDPKEQKEIPAPIQSAVITNPQSDEQMAFMQTIMLKMFESKGEHGSSGVELKDAYDQGITTGKTAMIEAITALNQQIESLKAERDEWKGKAETLQVELGKLPSDNEDDDEQKPEPEKTGSQMFFDKLSESLGTGLSTIIGNMAGGEQKPTQKQIDHKPAEKTMADIPSTIKQFIMQAFTQNTPSVQAAAALWKWIIDNNAAEQVKDYTEYPTKMILGYLVKKYMPQAEDALKNYAAQTIEELKKLAKT